MQTTQETNYVTSGYTIIAGQGRSQQVAEIDITTHTKGYVVGQELTRGGNARFVGKLYVGRTNDAGRQEALDAYNHRMALEARAIARMGTCD